jgi:hypothetical protein
VAVALELVAVALVEIVKDIVEETVSVSEAFWLYKFRRFGPPQYSVELPLQTISQPLDAGAPPLEIALPQSKARNF